MQTQGDLAEPECGLCRDNNRTCRRTSSRHVRFKRGMPEAAFSRAQAWPTIPVIVDFVDETELTNREYHVEAEHARLNSSPDIVGTGSASPAVLLSPRLGSCTPDQDQENIPTPFMTLCRGWTLKDPIESLLLQHFTNEVSWFFDFCDRERHFAIEVPHRARTCPPLLDAILAVSGRHLSRVRQDIDPFLADRYYQRCLESLIPELDRVGPHCVDDLLAAPVVLRLLEEFDVPLSGADKYQHSVGTRAILRSQTAQVPCATGLRRAASWAGLRQEIYSSLTTHLPPGIKASAELLDYLDSSPDDCTWANRAVNHCLDVLEHCFGESCKMTESFDMLLASNVQWETDRPPSYDPLCFRTEARSAIKLICSIALSNPSTPTAMVVACMAVQIGGDLLEDPLERQSVLKLLTKLEAVHGWPTKDVWSALVDLWPGIELAAEEWAESRDELSSCTEGRR
ncbi:hypothetical protein FDECE_14675 [Fusarium decemcellulare]|nr:hypothetical protein FDECE_14675 [Fusarium decemcellulare]